MNGIVLNDIEEQIQADRQHAEDMARAQEHTSQRNYYNRQDPRNRARHGAYARGRSGRPQRFNATDPADRPARPMRQDWRAAADRGQLDPHKSHPWEDENTKSWTDRYSRNQASSNPPGQSWSRALWDYPAASGSTSWNRSQATTPTYHSGATTANRT